MLAIRSFRFPARTWLGRGGFVRPSFRKSDRTPRQRVAKPALVRSVAANPIAAMEKDVEELVQRVHATTTQAVLYVTGGAVTALSWLMSVPGASRTVLEAVVPYSATSSDLLLKTSHTDSYSGLNQANRFAKAAYDKATALTLPGEWDFVGVAAVCALATDREKKGDHRCCVSIFSSKGTKSYSLTFDKGTRSRLEEEMVSSRLLLLALAEASGVHNQSVVEHAIRSFLHAGGQDELVAAVHTLQNPIELLVDNSLKSVECCGGNHVLDGTRSGALILPGSFNPLHEGHLQMMKAAEEKTGRRAVFELSVMNPDKGTLDIGTVQNRLEQFCSRNIPVLLTRASLFVDKTECAANCIFVVGYDTAVRIIQPQYYGDSETNMAIVLERIRSRGCRFLVAGRSVKEGEEKRFLTLQDMDVPSAFADLFEGLDDFRLDISSTEIRERASRD